MRDAALRFILNDYTQKRKHDFGLWTGVGTMKDNDQFLDYTIVVENKEFPVHKLVMVAVSDYFKAMLTGSMLESGTDRVNVKGLKAQSVSKLINLIYTGNFDNIKEDALELLECAVYFQMPEVIDFCTKVLLVQLDMGNCMRYISLFTLYALTDGVAQVEMYMQDHMKDILKLELDDILYEALGVVIEDWTKSQLDLVQFLHSWIEADSEDRKGHISNLMSKVNFTLLSPSEINAVVELPLLKDNQGPWYELVIKAREYHKSSISLKILSNAVNREEAEDNAVPVVFGTDENTSEPLMYCLRDQGWVKTKASGTPSFQGIVAVTVVNNFMVVCTGKDENQKWHVFDTRTMFWSEMKGLQRPRLGFPVVQQEKKLYVLGGNVTTPSKSLIDDIEVFHLWTGTWEKTGKMPSPVTAHAACVHNDSIYVSGGIRLKNEKFKKSSALDCFNTKTNEWLTKAPMPQDVKMHKMHLMSVDEREVFVVLDEKLETMAYDIENDQWTKYSGCYVDADVIVRVEWTPKSAQLAQGNTIHLLNVTSKEVDYSDDEDDDSDEDDFRPCACQQSHRCNKRRRHMQSLETVYSLISQNIFGFDQEDRYVSVEHDCLKVSVDDFNDKLDSSYDRYQLPDVLGDDICAGLLAIEDKAESVY